MCVYHSLLPQVRRQALSPVCQAVGSWEAAAEVSLVGLPLVAEVLQASLAKVQMVNLGPIPAWVVRVAATVLMAAAHMELGRVAALVG